MVYREEIKVMSQDKEITFHDVTAKTKEIVERSGIRNGIAVVYSHHTTCCVIMQECAFDMSMTGLETLQQDLVDVFEKIIPAYRRDGMYHHPGEKAIAYAAEHGESRRCCHNTDAHLRSVLMGRSVTVPIIDGEVQLGEFGFIWFADFDQVRARERNAIVQVMGIGK